MSAHNKKGVVTAKSSGIVVGDGKRHFSHYKLGLKLGLLGLLCFLLLAGIAGGIYKVMHHSVSQTANDIKLTPTLQADKLAHEGKYADAQAVLSKQVAQTNDKQTILNLYLQQAVTAENANNYADAKKYADKAEALSPSSATASLLGQIALQKGDKVTAKQYFQKAIDRLDKTSHTYARDLEEYQGYVQAAQ